jgi:hypothetical protein
VGEGLIGEILNKYGIWGIVVFIVGMLALPLSLKYTTEFVMSLFRKKIKDDIKEENSENNLSEHLFFTNAKFKLRFDIPTLVMKNADPVMEQLYRDLLYFSVESFYYGCKNISKTPNINELSSNEWEVLVRSELNSIMTSYEDKAEDWGVPKLIINRYIKWLVTYRDLLTEFITQIANADFYGDNMSRTNTFLLIMNLLIISMIGDIDKLVDETLGEFRGIEYRGSIIEV